MVIDVNKWFCGFFYQTIQGKIYIYVVQRFLFLSLGSTISSQSKHCLKRVRNKVADLSRIYIRSITIKRDNLSAEKCKKNWVFLSVSTYTRRCNINCILMVIMVMTIFDYVLIITEFFAVDIFPLAHHKSTLKWWEKLFTIMEKINIWPFLLKRNWIIDASRTVLHHWYEQFRCI